MSDNVSQLPTQSSTKLLRDCKTLGEAFQTKELKERIAGTLPKHMNPDTMLHAFINATGRTPLLKECGIRQVLGAFVQLSYLGLPPGTMQGLAHMIPFARYKGYGDDRRITGYDLQIIIGYPGYIELAHRSGFVTGFSAACVLPDDDFDFLKGTEQFLRHKPNMERWSEDVDPIACWARAQFETKTEEFEVMSWHEILSIRNMSSGYRAAMSAFNHAKDKGWRVPPAYSEAPWIRHARRMGVKTAIIRLAHLLPKCPELRQAAEIESAQEGGKAMDFSPIIDGDVLPEEGPIITDIDQEDDDLMARTADDSVAPSKTRQKRTRKTESAETEVEPNDDVRTEPVNEPPPVPPPPPPEPPMPPDIEEPPVTGSDFDYYLVDEFGAIIGSDKYSDPAAFIEDLLAYTRTIGDDAASEVQDANTEALHAAMQHPAAAKLMRGDIAEEPKTTPQAKGPPEPGTPAYDNMIADAYIEELRGITDRRTFDRWVSNPKVRSTMGGWRRTNKDAFDRVDMMAKQKNEQIPRG